MAISAAQYIANIRSNRKAKGLLFLVGGSAVAQVVSVLLSPVLTRIYTPADYGVAGLYASFLGIMQVVACLRLELFIHTQEDDDDAYHNVVLCILVSFVMCSALALVLTTMGKHILALMRIQELAPYLWLLPLSLFLVGTYNMLNYWGLRKRLYSVIARTKVSQSIAGSFTSLGMGFLLRSPLGLIIGGVVSQSAGIVSLAQDIVRSRRNVGFQVSPCKIRWIFRRHCVAALTFTSAQLLNVGSVTLPAIALASLYGTTTTGQFNLASRVVGLPGMLIGAAIMQVFSGEASALVRERPGDLYPYYVSMVRRCARLAFIPLLIGAVCPLMFPLVFGARWREAGLYAAVLSIRTAAQFVVAPTDSVMILCKKHWEQVRLDIFRVTLVLCALFIVPKLGFDAFHTVAAFSGAMVVVYGVELVAFTSIVRKWAASQ